MRPEDRDAAYLWDMLHAARKVRQFTEEVDLDRYLEDEKLQAAVERCLEIIGEAAHRVSEPSRKSHPEIPWRQIIGLRHILVHEYGEVIQARLWDVVSGHIPSLIVSLETLLPPAPSETPD